MATTRAFAYNPSLNPIPGTDSYGTLVIGTSNLDFSSNPGGIKWWMGPDEDLGYVIGGVASGGTQPSPIGDIGTVGFWRSENLTTEEFILLANQISGQYFTNTSDAITWLNNNGYWTSYDPLLITPTPSPVIQITPSVTPMATVTRTPQPTLTPTQTLPEPYLLDTYSGAVAAYSLRKLSSAYNGAAIRVRRSSDNTEQDIGFLNNGLDTMALTSFVSGHSGFVTVWYDQSGNGANALETVIGYQPRISLSGVTEQQNGRPTIYFNGAGLTTTASIVRKPQTVFFVSKPEFVNGYTTYFAGKAGSLELRTNPSAKIEFLSTYQSLIATSTNSVTTTFSILSFKLTSGGQYDFYLNNTNLGGGGTTGQGFPNSQMSIHREVDSFNGLSNTSEVIMFGADRSSDRTNINANINTYYTIF
jgi:hypothetical protein